MNFARLIRPAPIAPVPARFRLRGERTNCTTGETKSVMCAAQIKDGRALVIVEGGITGYEGFMIEPDVLENIQDGWTACGGTPNRWDTLYFDKENMTALVAWIKAEFMT